MGEPVLVVPRDRSLRDSGHPLKDRLLAGLLEFGHGTAFVGRQVRSEVGRDEPVVDLLLFHPEQPRYVIVDLEVGRLVVWAVGEFGVSVAVSDPWHGGSEINRPGPS